MSLNRGQYDHIVKIAENANGCDYIIGDLHGNRECLEWVLKELGPNDRLFIAGDLTDRGDDSPGVIRTIIENNAKSGTPKIHVIRGNHEDICLKAINALQAIAPMINAASDQILDDWINAIKTADRKKLNTHEKVIRNHLRNGGDWLVYLFKDELENGKIRINPDKTITYSADSEVRMINDYMTSLPYIMHVEGTKPFNIVHADLPVNDAELQRRMHSGELMLETKEYRYATLARENKKKGITIKDVGNNKNSSSKYVGHSITTKGARVARTESNTVNLDVGSFLNTVSVSLLVNHTNGVFDWVGPGVNNTNTTRFQDIETALDQHLSVQQKIKAFLGEAKACQSMPDLRTIISTWETKLSSNSASDLLECAINNNAVSDAVLLQAIKNGKLDELTSAGLTTDRCLSDGYTTVFNAALKEALLTSNITVVGQLESYYEKQGTTLLHAAVDGNDKKLVEMIINSKHIGVDKENAKGETALHCAAQQGNVVLAKVLLSKGADVNYKTAEKLLPGISEPNLPLGQNSLTPLFFAAMSGNEELVTVLLENKADPNAIVVTNGDRLYEFFANVSKSACHRAEKFIDKQHDDDNIEIKPEHFAALTINKELAKTLHEQAEAQSAPQQKTPPVTPVPHKK